jgi:hypothetical protein
MDLGGSASAGPWRVAFRQFLLADALRDTGKGVPWFSKNLPEPCYLRMRIDQEQDEPAAMEARANQTTTTPIDS